MRVATLFSVVLALLAVSSFPRTAEAQGRGTLQATAIIVDTRTGVASMEAARTLVLATVAPEAIRQRAVSTVAQVSVQRPQARPSALVVTIDYARN